MPINSFCYTPRACFLAPPAPENLDVLAKCNPYDQSCDVTIFWSTPELTPDEYELYIYSLKDDEIDDIRNVSVVGVRFHSNPHSSE